MRFRRSGQLAKDRPRLIYDGVCNLCTSVVRFLNAIDNQHAIEYVPYQKLDPDERRVYGLSILDLEGRMYMVGVDGSMLKGAAAITAICKLFAPIIRLCELFNTPFAQELYDFIARRRYKLFGCRDSCYVPTAVDAVR